MRDYRKTNARALRMRALLGGTVLGMTRSEVVADGVTLLSKGLRVFPWSDLCEPLKCVDEMCLIGKAYLGSGIFYPKAVSQQ